MTQTSVLRRQAWLEWTAANALGLAAGFLLGMLLARDLDPGCPSPAECSLGAWIATNPMLPYTEPGCLALAQWVVLRRLGLPVAITSWVAVTVIAGLCTLPLLSTGLSFGGTFDPPRSPAEFARALSVFVALGAVTGLLIAGLQWVVLARRGRVGQPWFIAHVLAWAAAGVAGYLLAVSPLSSVSVTTNLPAALLGAGASLLVGVVAGAVSAPGAAAVEPRGEGR